MIGTRHMVLGIAGCALVGALALVISVSGIFRSDAETAASVILFETPKDSYAVIPSEAPSDAKQREAFIEHIRTSFTVDPFESPETDPQPASETLGG